MESAKKAVIKLLENVSPIIQTPRKSPTRYEKYTFHIEEEYYNKIDRAHRGIS